MVAETLRELTFDETRDIAGALTSGETLGIGLGMVAIGLGIAAAPIGAFGLAAALTFSYWGGVVTGNGLYGMAD